MFSRPINRDISLFNIVNGLLREIFSAEDRRLRAEELKMVSKNRIARGEHTDGFFFQGHFFSDLEVSLQARGVKKPLHPSLAPDMARLMADRSMIQRDKDWVKQALTLILRDCKTPQDLRDALPNCASDIIDQTRHLERSRPEAYTLENNPRALQQYNKLREKIEFYTASKLLY